MPNPQYQTTSFILSSKGLNSRNTIDRINPGQYYNLDNAEVRQENSLASRLGRFPITYGERIFGHPPNVILPLPDTDIHNLARLKGLGVEAYRYAGAGPNLYRERIPGLPSGHFDTINGAFVFSGNQWSSANYRPDNSSTPYIFFADDNVMVKDNGSFTTVEQWGIFPPTAPPVLSLGDSLTQVIDSFPAAPGPYTISGFNTPTNASLVNTTLGTAVNAAPGFFTVFPPSMTNIIANSIVSVGTETNIQVFSATQSSFTAYFTHNHLASDAVVSNGISMTNTATITTVFNPSFSFSANAANQLNAGDGFIYLGLKLSDYTKVSTIGLSFYTPIVNAYNAVLTSTSTPPIGQTNAYQEIAIPISAFSVAPGAGTPGNSWVNVDAWNIGVNFTTSSGQTLTLGNISYAGGVGPTVMGTGASPYDYRITFYNINTGDESGPSVVMANFINPIGQSVVINFVDAVTPPPPIDPQVTHIRIYRLAVTLPNQWLQVGQVPIGTTTFTDTLTDQQIATNNILNVDTAPPVTSTLPVPVNTTLTSAVTVPGENIVSVGSTANMFVYQALTIDPLTTVEETVLVQAVGGGNITAYFQFSHIIGAVVQANTRAGQPCNIATIAFNRAWIAGDPNNPDILYYSDVFNPESFPVENFLEIGSPSDPIMAVMEWNGQLYVFTQNTVWNILGAQEGSQAPLPFKTAAKHGLQAQFGWCIAEGEIYYQSFGGIYAFQGSDSRYASADIEWIFTAQFIDDDIQRVVPLMDPTKISQTVMAYYQNEIYVAYTGQDGNTHRVIWDKVHGRWRNDDVPAICMLVEDDIYTLLFGTTTGMIYQDRIGNYDAGGLTGPDPIAFNVQTAALDLGMPKNFKNFNEFTIDIDTGGLPVTITLLFDYGLTPVPLGTVTTTGGRGQFEFNINNGDGQLSLNVSVQLTASITTNITSPIEVYELHIRATPEAELRESYDSYITDFGSPDYKFVKQGWFEYMALGAAGITFNFFVGGSTNPAFAFTVPQALTRTSKRVRFPATKGRIWRWVATSASPFRLYSDSRIEWKAVTQDKGYQVRPLQQETPQQP